MFKCTTGSIFDHEVIDLRLSLSFPSRAEAVLSDISADMMRRLSSGSPLLCPVDMVSAFLRLCHAQSCGKCVPCRIGLGQLISLHEQILQGEGGLETLEQISRTARAVANSADCAIGFEAARMVLRGLAGFPDDYRSHAEKNHCSAGCQQAVPCRSLCPAAVNIPGYIALVHAGRYNDAVRLILKDNPFPSVCGYVCEHPCEARCRRRILDDAVNIRGLKRFATDRADFIPTLDQANATGKRVAIIGAGPAGLTAACYLSLMGHSVTVFEKRRQPGGMLRYGIPRYRLPAAQLNQDIGAIVKAGVDLRCGVEIGNEITLNQLRQDYDAVYIAIGAHVDKKLRIPGSEGPGVTSAVSMLRDLGDELPMDLSGRNVVVVGGGNVAMDAARSSIRLGASRVSIVYRRRQEDMTALPAEIEGAIAEGCELITMAAPDHIERNENGQVCAFWAKPQIAGKLDSSGRPQPLDASIPAWRIGCDLVIGAIGQSIGSKHFQFSGIQLNRDAISARESAEVTGETGLFAGGDCVTGPATVIRAVAAGKVAAANIDEYLGYRHQIHCDVEIPQAAINNSIAWGRANMKERPATQRRVDFQLTEEGLGEDEALLECARCLRCDHFGYGPCWENRRQKW